MSNFHPLEFVGSGSETQLEVCDFLNYLICAAMVKLLLFYRKLIVLPRNDNLLDSFGAPLRNRKITFIPWWFNITPLPAPLSINTVHQ